MNGLRPVRPSRPDRPHSHCDEHRRASADEHRRAGPAARSDRTGSRLNEDLLPVTDPSGTTGDRGAESTPPRCLTSTGPGALLRCIIRKGPRSGVASGRGVPAVSTVTTSPLDACCATNVPRDVRPAGASTSPAAPPRREITVRSISSRGGSQCLVQLKIARELAGVRNLGLDDPSASRQDSHCNFGDRSIRACRAATARSASPATGPSSPYGSAAGAGSPSTTSNSERT